MNDLIKKKLLNVLEERKVSLAMLYDRQGRILWHTGRKISGKTVAEGIGFSKSWIIKTIQKNQLVDQKEVLASFMGDDLSQSAVILELKSLLIIPVADDYFLYVDSGIASSFSEEDREVFRMMGTYLGKMITGENEPFRFQEINGISPAIERVRDMILLYSREESPILLIGESGVGKSVVAEVIHRESGRKGEMTQVHSPSFPVELFEQILFGYTHGVSADAGDDYKGLVEKANGGTLFIEEIAEVPLSVQAKIIQLIDQKSYRRVGDLLERNADIRLISSISQDPLMEIQQGRLRNDLYQRLQEFSVFIPPLRERKEDIRSLVMENDALLKGKKIGDEFWDVMLNYDWPGNVRELFSVLKRAGNLIQEEELGRNVESVLHPAQIKYKL